MLTRIRSCSTRYSIKSKSTAFQFCAIWSPRLKYTSASTQAQYASSNTTTLLRLRTEGNALNHFRGLSTFGRICADNGKNNNNSDSRTQHENDVNNNNYNNYNNKSNHKRIATATDRSEKPTSLVPSAPKSINSHAKPNYPPAIKNYRYCKYPPRDELTNFRSLVEELACTNSPITKKAILSHYPEQAPLLSWIYDPLRQYNVSSATILKHAQLRAKQLDAAASTPETKPTYFGLLMNYTSLSSQQEAELNAVLSTNGLKFDHLSELLYALSTKTIVGYNALDSILIFMTKFCDDRDQVFKTGVDKYTKIIRHHLESPLSKLLLRILDKNLRVGCNVRLINETFPNLINEFHVSLAHSLPGLGSARDLFPPVENTQMNQSPSLSAGSNDTKTRNVVKKKAVKKVPDEWFASRKLDGVRCLTRINRITGDIETLSRRGRHFDNLTVTREALRQILSSSNGSDTSHTKGFDSKNWELFFRQTLGIKSSASDKEVPEEIYLDGEICIFKGSISDSANESAKNKKSNLIGENVEIIGGDNREDKLGREDFQKALSIAKRKGSLGSDKDSEDSEDSKVRDDMTDLAGESSLTETDIPVYCIFDCITDKEFTDCAGSRPFRSRIQGIAKTLSSRVTGKDNTQLYNSSTIRTLRHIKIENAAQLDKLVDMSVRLDWEGVMLRKNCGYEGKRSRNMLKIKKFLDAEYVVQEAMVGSMRVPIDGEFKECDNILTKVIIEHRGNKVGVGSGFSMEDRVKFGKDPSLIVGKTISVQYFEESCTTITGGNSNKVGSEDNLTSDKKEWSLRFPTVKAIYGIGPRDI